MPSYHHGDLKEALLGAALEVLTRQGEASLSLRALARHLGVSPGAPYRHYPDRDALLKAIVTRGFDQLGSAAAKADAAAPDGFAVTAQAIAYVHFAKDNPALLRLMFSGLRFDPIVAASAEAAYEVLASRLRRDRPNDPQIESRTLGAWSLMHGLALLTVDGQIDDKGSTDQVVSSVFSVLAAS